MASRPRKRSSGNTCGTPAYHCKECGAVRLWPRRLPEAGLRLPWLQVVPGDGKGVHVN